MNIFFCPKRTHISRWPMVLTGCTLTLVGSVLFAVAPNVPVVCIIRITLMMHTPNDLLL